MPDQQPETVSLRILRFLQALLIGLFFGFVVSLGEINNAATHPAYFFLPPIMAGLCGGFCFYKGRTRWGVPEPLINNPWFALSIGAWFVAYVAGKVLTRF